MPESSRRNRKTFRLDAKRLREERAARDTTDKEGKKNTFPQADMAGLIGIGLSSYQKAERGECIDLSIAEAIMEHLELDETDLGLQPCSAPPPPDTRPYLDFLHEDNAYIDVRGLLVGVGKAPRLPISEVYIPLRAAAGERDKTGPAGSNESRSVPLEQNLAHRKLVIVGDPGGGKSTFLKRLAWQHSGPGATQFPILIRIAALEAYIHNRVQGGTPDTPDADSAGWIPRYLGDRAKEFQWGLDADFFESRLRERSTLILFDGLDEIPNVPRREAIAQLFERATKAYRDARFVVTTRPAAYEGRATLDGFETVRIGEFEKDAVESFLGHWARLLYPESAAKAEEFRAALLAALGARPDIRRMARNPLMLTALAVLQHNDKKLPERRALLYASILKWLSEAKTYPDRPDGGTCLSIFASLALGMHCYEGGRAKQIEKAEAAKLIRDEFTAYDEPHRRESAAREFLEKEFIDSGIVVSRGDSLEFWHLTFQEFLAARACIDRGPSETLLKDDHWLLNEWREVALLVPSVLIESGKTQVHALFKAMLDRAEQRSASLSTKARAAGLIGAALRDLRPSNVATDSPSYYRLPDQDRYKALLIETLGIFDKDRAAGVDLKVRVEAAEALGQAGDPRLNEDNWIPIDGGTFHIGAQKTRKTKPGYDPDAFNDEGPVRDVTVEPFQIGRYPVTVQEFEPFVEDNENGYQKATGEAAPQGWDEQKLHPNRPVVNVNWFAADAYCKWMTAKQEKTHRLPTEAEWEFAARGKEGRKYPWGNEPPDISRANYDDAHINAPTPVGLFPNGATPGPEGKRIDDMAGNVYEWTADCYGEKQNRVVRGGGWDFDSWYLRAAYRNGDVPGVSFSNFGFRVVREA